MRDQTKEIQKLQTENAKLKMENNQLKKKITKQPPKKRSRSVSEIARKSGVILLVSFAVALLLSANLLFWVGNTVVKQDRFVAATAPIIKDPVVQNTMALYTTNKIFSNVDVQGSIEQVLPPRADFLAPQLSKQLKTGVQSTLQKVLANPNFQAKWNQVQARQHDRLISFASKYQGDGDINLNDIFNQLTANLANTKLSFLAGKQLPSKVGDIKVISAPWLPAFHKLVTKIDTWRTIAAVLLALTVMGAVWLSRNRRRTVYIFSIASVVMMLFTLVALHVIRDRIIGKVDPQYAEGVRHVIQIVFHSLVLQTVTIMAAAAFVGVVGWVSGSSKSARAFNRQVNLLFSGKLHSTIFAQDKAWTIWVQNHKRQLEWATVGVIGAIMLLVHLTLQDLVIYIGLIIMIVLVIEVIGGQSDTPRRVVKKSS
jgi:hypothetical protein